MMTLKPSARALVAKSTRRSGVRWAETIRASYSTSSASSVSAARRMVGQSVWLPMTMATSGFVNIEPYVPQAPQSAHLAQISPQNKAAEGSGDDVGQQNILQLHDAILERQLSFFQPL